MKDFPSETLNLKSRKINTEQGKPDDIVYGMSPIEYLLSLL